MILSHYHRARLTTAEIVYHMPDYPQLLQTYIWQQPDLAPEFPALHRFLDFWEHNLEGRLHSVKIASTRLARPKEVRFAAAMNHLH